MRLPFAALMLTLAAFPTLAGEVEVKARSVDDLKAVFATVESVDQVLARARIPGTVSGLLVDEGSQVRAGDRIANVGDPKLALATAGVDAKLKAAEAERDLAAIESRRAAELLAKGAATTARVDDARTRLEVAERTISALRAEKQVTAERTGEGAVLAPTSGRVLKVHITEGSVVLAGETIATIAAETYVLRMALPERHARFLKVGDAVLVGQREMAPGDAPRRQGTVRQVYPRIEDGRVIADVAVERLDGFFVGERVPVHVATGSRTAFIIPREAVSRRFGVDYVRLKDGATVVVQLGQATGDEVEVLSGLKNGDQVVW
ncbi:efflux RND transporter periplasmic adaptor subunit [Magnetospirillum sp. UT-4]|uniref:efflux RND transporter periplasmic adaptor subunit n=1 Tax=Magnetospirillum sp. UT-4 TaxID=2681467 RepID=UPI0013822DCC|nr:efflux RND transporter periplasmic adaptor subunit [Magnetospirillum sp. UT-4]CAA7620535.1 putative membrane fusion protein, component of an efflux pump (RND family, MFP subunit) [Magnetospirillum sp. UT-4]